MNKDSELFWVLMAGVALGAIMVAIVTYGRPISTKNVTSGNQFIFKNASYKCKKTNELREK